MTGPAGRRDPAPGLPGELGRLLLDRQVEDEGGHRLGKVDDLELEERDGELLVTTVLLGAGALAPRIPGATGRWMAAVWRRLSPDRDPGPLGVPLTEVVGLGVGVTVRDRVGRPLETGAGLEAWCREHVVAHLPGGSRAAGRSTGPPPARRDPGAHRLGALLDSPVRLASGEVLGRVAGCVAERLDPGLTVVGPLRVTDVVVHRHRVGSALGYDEPREQGPALLARVVRALHRGDRLVPAGDLAEVSWAGGGLRLRRGARPRAPRP